MENKLDSDIVEDEFEHTLKYARCFKKKLRWEIGQIVYLRSDKNKECGLTIHHYNLFDSEYDYVVSYIHPKKKIPVREFYLDQLLTQ